MPFDKLKKLMGIPEEEASSTRDYPELSQGAPVAPKDIPYQVAKNFPDRIPPVEMSAESIANLIPIGSGAMSALGSLARAPKMLSRLGIQEATVPPWMAQSLAPTSDASTAALERLAGNKVKGVYAFPTHGGAPVDYLDSLESGSKVLSNTAPSHITGPNRGLAEYRALGTRDIPTMYDPQTGKRLEPEDIEMVVRGLDRGSHTELVSPYTLLNKSWAWGKKKP